MMFAKESYPVTHYVTTNSRNDKEEGDELHQSVKGYKAVSKALELQRTTVRASISK